MSQDKIASVECNPVAPRWLFVRVETSQGLVGWGEAIVPKRARAVVGAVDDLALNIAGADPDRIEELVLRMGHGGFFRGTSAIASAAAGIEQALWDIKGRRYGLAVHEFLGGAVRDRTRLYAWIGGDRPGHVVEHTRQRIAQGFTMVKMNATEELDYIDTRARVTEVVERVASIRDAVGDGIEIALDFHGRVHRAMVKVLIRELEPFHLAWIEEPLSPGFESELPHLLSPDCSIPIATGERLVHRTQFRELFRHGVVDIVQPDVSLTGIYELAKIAHMAEAYDVAVAPHCPNGPISLAASLQVGFATANVVVQEQSVGLHYNQGYEGLPAAEMFDYVRDPAPLVPADGHLALNTRPGLGLDIDEDAVRGSRQWELRDPEWRHEDGRMAEW
ncbi:galactonate dehydratase [Sinomonas sp. P47F7]|uniref:galactonate dehydratase n=1 Tax=Sinomonas sp. P47F7 TaxID=3410987 RepID=UPI003BF5CAF0